MTGARVLRLGEDTEQLKLAIDLVARRFCQFDASGQRRLGRMAGSVHQQLVPVFTVGVLRQMVEKSVDHISALQTEHD